MNRILVLLLLFLNTISCKESNNSKNNSYRPKDSLVSEAIKNNAIEVQPINESEINEIKKLILGNWVNKKLISGLEQGRFANAHDWVNPCRSFTFVVEKKKLICYYEVDYEQVYTYPKQTIVIQKLLDSKYKIHMDNGKFRYPNDFIFDKKDSTILIENTNSIKVTSEKYSKVWEPPYETKQPIDFLLGYKLLNGRFKIYDFMGRQISTNSEFSYSKVTNFEKFKVFIILDLQFYEDRNGNRYPIFGFKRTIDNPSLNDEYYFAYKKDGKNIQLYSFKAFPDLTKYNTPIDSLVLKYTLMPIK